MTEDYTFAMLKYNISEIHNLICNSRDDWWNMSVDRNKTANSGQTLVDYINKDIIHTGWTHELYLKYVYGKII
jgi:hypothetical protein